MNRRPAAIAVRSTLLLPAAVLLLALPAPARAQDDKPSVAFAASPPGLTPAADSSPEIADTTTPPADSAAPTPSSASTPSASRTDNTAPLDNSAPADAASVTGTSALFLSQPDSAGPAPGPTSDGLDSVTRMPPNPYSQQESSGIPYSSVLNRDEPPDFNNIGTLYGSPFDTSIYQPAKIGEAEGGFGIQTGNFTFGSPLLQAAGEPQDADIKAGPFFVKFRSLQGLVLYDTTSQPAAFDRRSELLVLLSLNLTIIAQLADNLQFSITGSIDYLPLQNQVGVVSSAYSGLGLIGLAAPFFQSELAYDTIIAGWDVQFADQFGAHSGAYSNSVRDNFSFFQGDSIYEDQTGAYKFHSGSINPRDDNFAGAGNTDDSIVYFSNVVSALTTHYLPGDTVLTASVSHEDLWYNQSNRGLPQSRDDFDASIVSHRPNLRFKPYLSYAASYIEGYPGITQQLRAGFSGPIDDQLFLDANAGLFVDYNGHAGELYQLILSHEAGPYTNEYLSLARSLSSFNQDQVTSEYYRLRQVLGPTLNGELFAAHLLTEDLTTDHIPTRSDYIGGLGLDWVLGPKTSLSAYATFQRQKYDGGEQSDTVTGRLTLNRILTDTLYLQIFYQYQRSISSQPNDTYYDNLVYLRAIKYFQ